MVGITTVMRRGVGVSKAMIMGRVLGMSKAMEKLWPQSQL